MEPKVRWAKGANWLTSPSLLCISLLANSTKTQSTVISECGLLTSEFQIPPLGVFKAQMAAQLRQSLHLKDTPRKLQWHKLISIKILLLEHTRKRTVWVYLYQSSTLSLKTSGAETFNHSGTEWLLGTACLWVYFYSVLKCLKRLAGLMD